MQPVDFAGRPIYGRAWQALLAYGHHLQELGYRESAKTPNVFWKAGPEGIVFFANMRGNPHVSIWSDPRPLFGWKSSEIFACNEEHTGIQHDDDGTPCARNLRLREFLKSEIGRLADGGVPVRVSFFDSSEPEGLFFGDFTTACPDCGADLLQGRSHEPDCASHAHEEPLRSS